MEVYVTYGQDEVRLGTLREVVNGEVNVGVIILDIVADMMYNGDDEVQLTLAIK